MKGPVLSPLNVYDLRALDLECASGSRVRRGLPAVGQLPPRNTIDIWFFCLDSIIVTASDLQTLLSTDEQTQAARFRFARDAARYLQSHAALRLLLARYLQHPASDLIFSTDEFGKPRLAGKSRLRFNLAHSDGMAAIAFATDTEVGIDLERVIDDPSVTEVAAAYFTAQEICLLERTPGPEARIRTFLRLWTRKEAILKAVGCGLDAPLNAIDVSHGNSIRICPAATNGMCSEWQLQDLDAGAYFIGAVAASGHDRVIRSWPS